MRALAHVEALPQLDGSPEAARARLGAIDARYREQSPTRPNDTEDLFELGVRRGREQMRGDVFEFLRAQAALHHGQGHDQ